MFLGKETLELSPEPFLAKVEQDIGGKWRKNVKIREFCFPSCKGEKRKLKSGTELKNP